MAQETEAPTTKRDWATEFDIEAPELSERFEEVLDELVEKSVILPQLPPDADFIGRFRPPSPSPAPASSDAAVAEGSAGAPQPVSGGKGIYPVNPKQRLLRIECPVPRGVWQRGSNRLEIRVAARGSSPAHEAIQIEKIEAHLRYG